MKKTLFTIILSLSLLPLMANETTPTEQIDTLDNSIIAKIDRAYTENMSYGFVATLMAVESSFIPFPSEIVVPPAAYVASKPESNMTVWGVVLAATLGALLGAIINYLLAIWLGRLVIYRFVETKWGHALLLSKEKVERAEAYFVEHGAISTLIGRLVPVVRQLISIPAGLAKMRILPFVCYTTLGAMVWNTILAVIGYIAQGQEELIHRYSHELSVVLLAAVGVGAVVLVVRHLRKKKQ